MELIDYITDLLIDFDEMGFAPTTTCPNPEAYAIEWRNKITKAFKELTEENERLINAGFDTTDCAVDKIRQAKADTVRKMQEALEHRIHSKLSYHGWYLKETVIAETAKEMLEGQYDKT